MKAAGASVFSSGKILGPPLAPEPLPEQMSSLERAAGEARAAPAARRPREDQEAWEGGFAATAHGPQPLSPSAQAATRY